jgi:O-antigen/teichoic acid export membrane protein
MFYLQASLTVFILLHFPDILNLLFHSRGGELLSFRVFAVFAPGLIFFAAVASQEAVYEAADQVSDLKKIVLIVTVVDTALNIYLVPFAGVFGAAAATMISMLVYFFIFDRFLTESRRITKAPYLFAGAGVYLLYALMAVVKFSLVIDFFLIPLGLFVMLLVMGYFQIEPRKTLEEINGAIR